MTDANRLSAFVYTLISLSAAALFIAATYVTGVPYPAVARIGGAVWVFLLSMIITMPLVIPYLKKRKGV